MHLIQGHDSQVFLAQLFQMHRTKDSSGAVYRDSNRRIIYQLNFVANMRNVTQDEEPASLEVAHSAGRAQTTQCSEMFSLLG